MKEEALEVNAEIHKLSFGRDILNAEAFMDLVSKINKSLVEELMGMGALRDLFQPEFEKKDRLIESQARELEEERRKSESQAKELEEERKKLEEERRKSESQAKELEEERKKLEEERRRSEEDRKTISQLMEEIKKLSAQLVNKPAVF